MEGRGTCPMCPPLDPPLRSLNTLKDLLDNDPDSVNIFNSNLIDDFYPA